jgi:predicted DNA-binding transcriptional regulator AlpA
MHLQELNIDLGLPDRVISEALAAEFLGISHDTLKRMHAAGKGPRRIRVSDRRVGYKLSELKAYVDRRVA